MTANFFTQLLKARTAYLWDDGGAALPGRIDPTDAARERDRRPVHADGWRGRGYGTAAVAALSGLLFGGGSSSCYSIRATPRTRP